MARASCGPAPYGRGRATCSAAFEPVEASVRGLSAAWRRMSYVTPSSIANDLCFTAALGGHAKNSATSATSMRQPLPLARSRVGTSCSEYVATSSKSAD
jgi:hypothetical protein